MRLMWLMTFVIGVAVLWGGSPGAQMSQGLVANGGGRLVGENYVILGSALGQPAIGSFSGSFRHQAVSGYVIQRTASIPFAPTGSPVESALEQNSPNPFNPETYIHYAIREQGAVRLQVYDVDGRLTKTLVEQKLPAGEYTAHWDGTDTGGNSVASGIYFYRLEVGDFRDTKKMVLLK